MAINSIQKYSTSDDILIEILKDGDIEYLPFDIEDYKTTVFSRLTEINDITHVEVHCEGEGVVAMLTCPNCNAEAEFSLRTDEEE